MLDYEYGKPLPFTLWPVGFRFRFLCVSMWLVFLKCLFYVHFLLLIMLQISLLVPVQLIAYKDHL